MSTLLDQNTETQSDAILEALKNGQGITPLDALQRFGCFRLGARVWDLKKQGWDIEMKMVSSNGKRFAEYRLLRKEPAQMVLI